jgi:hypothetical protein
MDKRRARVVERWGTSPSGHGSRSHWLLRVVLCLPGQRGYLNEPGVVKIWESETYTYHGTGPDTKYQRLLAEAERVAAEANANLEAGLVWDTPAGIRADYLMERESA